MVTGDAIAAVRLPESGSVTLGRADDCDVPIDDPSVSRRHAVLHVGPPLSIEDLGSANGTFVGDTRRPAGAAQTYPLRRLSKERAPIAVGQRVNVGAMTVVVRRSAEGSPREAGAARREAGSLAQDPAMRALYEQAGRAARSAVSVLLLGIAAKIDDAEYRQSFLGAVPENARTLSLAERLLGSGPAPRGS